MVRICVNNISAKWRWTSSLFRIFAPSVKLSFTYFTYSAWNGISDWITKWKWLWEFLAKIWSRTIRDSQFFNNKIGARSVLFSPKLLKYVFILSFHTYRMFFYWSARMKSWHLELFWWDLLCNLTLKTFRGAPVKKNTLYLART